MKFKPGISPNPSGRPKGVPNKVTSKLRETLADFLVEQIKELPLIFAQLSPDQKIDCLVKISAYVIPKLSMMSIDPGLSIESFLELSDADREAYLSDLRVKVNNSK
jgi:hypothetical protein